MLNFTGASLKFVSLHLIGNKSRGEDAVYSDKLLNIDDETERALLKFVLSPFIAKEELYRFSHHDDTKFNVIKNYSSNIFNSPKCFLEHSKKIAKHLYSAGNHPNIKNGELIVCLFSGISLDEKAISCLGIFKSETKDYFLTYPRDKKNSLSAKLEKGANLNSLDKGALIFLADKENEPQVLILDKKSADAQYWLNSFLNVQIVQNSTYATDAAMKSCLSYSSQIGKKNISKTDAIEINQYISEYFKQNSTFSKDDFFSGLRNKKYSADFEVYVSKKANDLNVDITSGFIIDRNRATKIAGTIKNIIKLDTKIELRVDSNERNNLTNLERGYDEEKKMFFYKVYFHTEIE